MFIKRFYNELLWLYTGLKFPDIPIGRERFVKQTEIENDKMLYTDFLVWANSSQNLDLKKDSYKNTYVKIFGEFPEGYRITFVEQQTIPEPEFFINKETDGNE